MERHRFGFCQLDLHAVYFSSPLLTEKANVRALQSISIFCITEFARLFSQIILLILIEL